MAQQIPLPVPDRTGRAAGSGRTADPRAADLVSECSWVSRPAAAPAEPLGFIFPCCAVRFVSSSPGAEPSAEDPA
ncbi:hypothetical protein [Inquilinus sp. CA228]|uniref:hypothetical protein n=1 Tax=Inquilinus sp. CA228 TaxID=3455609 RepID=UPI003F8D0C01